MKKILSILLALLICTSFTMTAYASAEEEETEKEAVAVDQSVPRLMVTDFKVEGGSLMPNKETEVSITFKNYSNTKYIKNIKLSLDEGNGNITPVGTGSKYVDVIYAGSTYTWKVKLTAAKTAEIGQHAVTVTSEYEDKEYNTYSGSDTIRINVQQTVGLDYSGVKLPVKVTQEDTTTMEISIMNTGKSKIRNCKIDFDIKGLESGGSTYIGEIPAGESASASPNLRVSSTELGDISGTVTISYEDEFGKEYTETEEVTTKIIEKVEIQEEEVPEEKNNKLWWLFLIIGIVCGGTVGAIIPISIQARKQRKEDELRL